MTDLAAVQPGDWVARLGRHPKENPVQPYTDADVELAAAALARAWDYRDPHTLSDARAVLDALVAASRLREDEAVNDIEATGRCCCAGCIGMGPCDRDLGRTDD